MDLYGGCDGMGNKTTIKRDVQMKKADSTALGRSVCLSNRKAATIHTRGAMAKNVQLQSLNHRAKLNIS